MTTASFSPVEPVTRWLSFPEKNDRDMELVEDFAFIDSKGNRWDAPKWSKINGASIPSSLWSTVGSPFTGPYRRATIVHDVACVNAKNDAERAKADLMFYEACLAGGCSKFQANTLYMGVRVGAWWSPPSSTRDFELGAAPITPKTFAPDSDLGLKVFMAVQKKLGDRMAVASRTEIDELVATTVAKSLKAEASARTLKQPAKKGPAKKAPAVKKAIVKKVTKSKTVSRR
jgi:Protein of unknown function (DUF1353)